MEKACAYCHVLLKEGDKVRFLGETTYHIIPSKIAFALDRDDLRVLTDTLRHCSCQLADE